MKYKFEAVLAVHRNYVARGLSHMQAYDLLSKVVGHQLASKAYLIA